MKKVFITGISGFAGGHLLKHLTGKDYEIFGTYLYLDNLKRLNTSRKVNLSKIDLRKDKEVYTLIEKVKPDIIFHLAALPSSSDSFNQPQETIVNNVSPQINILESLRKLNLTDCIVLVISSAEIYGKVSKENLPIDEETPFNPTNPYAVSKLTQDFLGLQYFLSYNLRVIRVRPFNHIGPGQSLGFVVSDFAEKIARIEKGKAKPILSVGNLEAKRDFTDVRDMVRAYGLAVEKGIPGEVYNIGSGKSYKISEILKILLSFSKEKIIVRVDKSLFRPVDNPELVCDPSKFIRQTGWTHEIEIEKTLKDTLDYWRNII